MYLVFLLRSLEAAGVESFFQLLVGKPNSQSLKFPWSVTTERGTAPGVKTKVTPGAKSTKEIAKIVSGGICSSVLFIPNSVKILKNIQETFCTTGVDTKDNF